MQLKHKYLLVTLSSSIIVAAALLYYRDLPTSLVYCIVAFGVIAAGLENIFFETDIIRDRFTISGIVLGILCSAAIPAMQNEHTHLAAAFQAATWAILTYGLLVLFVELEGRYSGPRDVELSSPATFRWSVLAGTPTLALGSELFLWSDLFSRKRSEVRIECDSGYVDGVPITSSELVFRQDKLFIGGRRYLLKDVAVIGGRASHVSFPRESIGLGVIKAMAAFSAIFGWSGALFIFFGSAIISTALRTPLLHKSLTNSTVPLMPFLAIAALIWMFFGHELVHAYLSLTGL
jgi:leader peptidase (prepilin peptidase) / N-methyltransferase